MRIRLFTKVHHLVYIVCHACYQRSGLEPVNTLLRKMKYLVEQIISEVCTEMLGNNTGNDIADNSEQSAPAAVAASMNIVPTGTPGQVRFFLFRHL
jgi:hypothetical protein